MGIPDLGDIFDMLDPARRGYLTVGQLCTFHESVHFSTISEYHVEAAIKQICGSPSQREVKKEHFIQVLQEMCRRQQAEQQARWDFLALDKTASYLIPVKDALLLMRNTHGPDFSMYTWNKFLDSRENRYTDVYFDEIKMWLVNLPEGNPSDSNEINEEEDRLTNLKQAEIDQEYQSYKNRKEALSNAREQAEHDEKTQRLARRKLDKWEKDGVEALLFDDGLEHGGDTSEPIRKNVGINDLLDALETKYDALRRKLFWNMLHNGMDPVMWSSMSDSDQLETFRQLQLEERQMRKDDSLANKANQLPGADVSQNASLITLMGELKADFIQHKNDLHERRMQLKSEGKSDQEVDKILQNENSPKPCHSKKLLVDLHKRYQQERSELLHSLHSDGSSRLTSTFIINALAQLSRQLQLTEIEQSFDAASMAIGLTERKQAYKPESYDPDRVRQVSLAQDRLEHYESENLKAPGYELEGATKGQGLIELHLAIVKEIFWKHTLERQALITFLTGQDSQTVKSAASQMSPEQRTAKTTQLRNQRIGWKNGSSDHKLAQKPTHHKLLQEGVGLYYEDTLMQLANSGLSPSVSTVNSNILADLQQKQDMQFDDALSKMKNMTQKDLTSLFKTEKATRVEEHLDCLAAVVLGSFETKDEEIPYINALEEKYNALRHVLLQHALEAEHGLGWETMDLDEKQRLLVKKKMEEKRMRQDGRIDNMATIISKIPQNIGSIRELMGEDRGEYWHRRNMLQEKLDQAALQGQPLLDQQLTDEAPASKFSTSDLLVDLLHRFYAEQDALISWLRAPDQQKLSDRNLQIPLVSLKLESRKIEREGLFHIAALSAALTERVEAALGERHPEDCNRQTKLSRLRAEHRKERLELGRPLNKEVDQLARPEKGDWIGWQESYLSELDKKHAEEREVLLLLLQDPSMEDLHQVAKAMSPAERNQRLLELHAKRHKLNLQVIGDREENLSILEEAAALQSVQRHENLTRGGRHEVAMDEVIAIILTDLQDVQDRELGQAFIKLPSMDEEALKRYRQIEIKSRHQGAADNVLVVLTRSHGSPEEDELLKALEEKYDTLKDKLLLEALMNQMGEAEWKNLSEEERQRRLMELKLKEKKLRREGRYDELERLLGEGVKADEKLRKLMGDHKAEYNRKLKERMARRQKLIDQGIDPTSEEEDDVEEDEDEDDDKKSGLAQLQSRFEQDRAELLARLRGMGDEFLSEQERQAELVRLRREKRRAEEEDNFDNAALIVGLAERQNAAMEERLKKDRLRQEQLARERLEALRNRRGEKMPPESQELVKDGGLTHLQDVLLKRLDEKHTQERLLLAQMIPDASEEERLIAKASSSLEREEKQQELKSLRSSLNMEDKEENRKLLLLACAYKLEGRHETLVKQQDGDVSEDDLMVTLMADLQQLQDHEAEQLLKDIQNKSESALIEMQATVLKHIKYQRLDNVAAMLFDAEHSGNAVDDLADALESKYDALRDKLMMEALMQQYGEAAWRAMSERERQCRMAELKLKEKQLRKAGRMDDAALLLGEAVTAHEHLEKLMGDNRAEQERRLKERLEKRKQRLAEGMAEDEADQLEKQEIAEEEEEDRKRRNVLLDLQHCYDKEQEELMQRLKNCNNRAAAEQLRQQELARIKREQRKARQEDMFDAAAIVLGLADEHEKAKQADRERQERLARERLAARQARAGKGKEDDSSQLADLPEVEVPPDPSDLLSLKEALLQEAELKHRQERDTFMKILQGATDGQFRNKAHDLSSEQRQDRLEELNELRDRWRQCGELDTQDQEDLFQEAAGIQLEVIAAERLSDGLPSSDEDVQVMLLADLQQKQDQEMYELQTSWKDKDFQELMQLKQVAAHSRKEQKHDHIAAVLLKSNKTQSYPESDENMTAEESEVVDALNKKYDALRDKLLMEALMKESGEAEWASLSEKDRQEKLVQLKLQERRLRREGQYDEAAALLGKFLDEETELQKKLGDSQSEQKRKLEERLKRRQELMAERKANGLTTEGAVVDAILDQEEEQQEKRKNILETLQHHYDDEKDALLAALRGENERFAAEKRRQLELAKLRQQQKQLAREDKFDSAALLLGIAEQQQKALEARLMSQRDRQRELALERIAAKRRQQLKDKDGDDDVSKTDVDATVKKLKEQIEKDKKEELERGDGVKGLPEAVLSQLDKKQAMERDILWSLILAAQKDSQGQMGASNMTTEEKSEELEKLVQQHSYWKSNSQEVAAEFTESSMDQDASLHKIAESLTEQFKLLTSAMVIRLQAEQEYIQSINPEKDSTAMEEEISVNLLTILQQKQTVEQGALDNILQEQDKDKLKKVLEAQKTATLHGWANNLTNTLFTVPDPLDPDEQADLEGPDDQEVLQQLEAEFEKEKVELGEKLRREAQPGETVDVNAELARLEAQQDSKRRALNAVQERQRLMAREKLEKKRHARDMEQYEQDAVFAMLKAAENRDAKLASMASTEQDRQKQLMREKLEARRRARQQAMLPLPGVQVDQPSEDGDPSDNSRPSTRESRISKMSLHSSLVREKTAFDLEVTEDEKASELRRLLDQQDDRHRRISIDLRHQQERLQRRLEARKDRRQEEAVELLKLGERQRNSLERSKQEERERQIAIMKERVERVRYERTLTMKGGGQKSLKDFGNLVDDDKKDLTKDQKMALVAQKIQQKFQKEEQEVKQGKKSLIRFQLPPVLENENNVQILQDDGDTPEKGSSRKMTEEDRMAILKQKRLERKRLRQQSQQQEQTDG